jgi:hypothetical protein
MLPLKWRLIYWDFPQLAYPATLAPRCLFPYVLGAWGDGGGWRLACLGGYGTRRSDMFGVGLRFPFPYNAKRSCARRFPQRCSDGADHVRAASDRNDNGFLNAWCTGQRRRRQRTSLIVRAQFGVGTLGRRVRFPCSDRVRTPHNRGLRGAPPETPDSDSRRLRSRSPVNQRAHYSVP